MRTLKFEQDDAGTWWHRFPDGRRMRTKTYECEYCKQSFMNYRQTRFCSQSCRTSARFVMPPARSCCYCHRDFLTKESVQRYCSHKCAASAMHASRPVTTDTHNIEVLVNADNPRYSQDEAGQWWYQPGGVKDHGRTRASVSKCNKCGTSFLICLFHSKKQEYCSRRCALRAGREANPDRFKGERGSNWKGGRRIDPNGYVLKWCPDHPTRANTTKPYVLEHRLVMEEMLGRYMEPHETVHHKNGIRDDNRPENLELWAGSHKSGQRANEGSKHCPTCTCFE